MKSVRYRRTGDVDVLELVDTEPRAAGPGEVVVRVHRSGVNPTDWKARQGLTYLSGPVDPPQVPGHDGAGVVAAVGPGVAESLVGARVWVWEAAYQRPDGTTQELAVVPAAQVVLLPEWASFDLGASLGIPFLTAHRGLTVGEDGPEHLGPGTLSGKTVLVAGGAGAVGNAAIQLARWSDARVVATVSSPEKAALATAAGADLVIDYRKQDVIEQVRAFSPSGVDIVVEVAPAVNAGLDAAVIGRNGVVAVYADNGGSDLTIPVRSMLVPNARWQFLLLYTEPAEAKRRAVEDVTEAMVRKALAVGENAGLPLHHFPLADTKTAHLAVRDGTVGKVIIDISD